MRTGRVLRHLGEALDPPAGPVPARVRQRVLGEPAVAPARRRARWVLATAVAAAAVVAGAVIVQTVRTAPVPDLPPAGGEALEVLSRAAAFVRQEAPLSPQGGQYVFIEIQAWVVARGTGSGQATLIRSWRSVNGDADGLVRRAEPGPDGRVEFPIPGCRDGRAAEWTEDGRLDATRTRPCEPEPGYRADLPTDPGTMLTFLQRHPAAKAGDQGVFAAVVDLLQQTYVQPQARSALFLTVARLPGVSIRAGVTDAAGRPGVAVGQGGGIALHELIFAPDTGQFLGTQLRTAGSETDGTTLRPTALLRTAIVGGVGQLPG